MTPDDEAMIAGIQADLIDLAQRIATAESEDQLYSGGLIKSLIAVRLQILRTTQALLEQRIHAIQAAAPITITLPASPPDPVRAEALTSEIRSLEAQLQASRADAAQYVGGLVHSLKLSTVATQEQTLAMAHQHYLTARYGLALPVPSVLAESTSPAPHTAIPPTPAAPAPPMFEIVKVDTRVTESNTSWARFAWLLTIKNLTQSPLRLFAHIEFLDAQGFTIAEDHGNDLILKAGAVDTFNGNHLITASVAGDVRSITAKVKAH